MGLGSFGTPGPVYQSGWAWSRVYYKCRLRLSKSDEERLRQQPALFVSSLTRGCKYSFRESGCEMPTYCGKS